MLRTKQDCSNWRWLVFKTIAQSYSAIARCITFLGKQLAYVRLFRNFHNWARRQPNKTVTRFTGMQAIYRTACVLK